MRIAGSTGSTGFGTKQATGPIGSVMLVLFLLSVIRHNALNLYCAVLAAITSARRFAYRRAPTAKARAA